MADSLDHASEELFKLFTTWVNEHQRHCEHIGECPNQVEILDAVGEWSHFRETQTDIEIPFDRVLKRILKGRSKDIVNIATQMMMPYQDVRIAVEDAERRGICKKHMSGGFGYYTVPKQQ